jgi:hypothetical protein
MSGTLCKSLDLTLERTACPVRRTAALDDPLRAGPCKPPLMRVALAAGYARTGTA